LASTKLCVFDRFVLPVRFFSVLEMDVIDLTADPPASAAFSHSAHSTSGAAVAQSTQEKRGRGRPRKRPKSAHFSVNSKAEVVATDEMVHFSLIGMPVAKKRPGVARNGHRYNASRAEEDDFAMATKSVLPSPFSGFDSTCMLVMDVAFVYPSKKNILATADVDNLAKFVMDAMNGILYHDDKQIVELHARKYVSPVATHGCITVNLSKHK